MLVLKWMLVGVIVCNTLRYCVTSVDIFSFLGHSICKDDGYIIPRDLYLFGTFLLLTDTLSVLQYSQREKC